MARYKAHTEEGNEFLEFLKTLSIPVAAANKIAKAFLVVEVHAMRKGFNGAIELLKALRSQPEFFRLTDKDLAQALAHWDTPEGSLARTVEHAQRTVNEDWPDWMRRNRDASHVPIRSSRQRTETGDMPDDMVEVQ